MVANAATAKRLLQLGPFGVSFGAGAFLDGISWGWGLWIATQQIGAVVFCGLRRRKLGWTTGIYDFDLGFSPKL